MELSTMEFKEIPFTDEEQVIPEEEEQADESQKNDLSQEDIDKRKRQFSINLYRFFAPLLLILGGICLILTILTFFFNSGLPDPLALLITQVIGFVLVTLAGMVGFSLLRAAKKLERERYIREPLEPIIEEEVE
jgi:FtsH-binding integral membrane protein